MKRRNWSSIWQGKIQGRRKEEVTWKEVTWEHISEDVVLFQHQVSAQFKTSFTWDSDSDVWMSLSLPCAVVSSSDWCFTSSLNLSRHLKSSIDYIQNCGLKNIDKINVIKDEWNINSVPYTVWEGRRIRIQEDYLSHSSDRLLYRSWISSWESSRVFAFRSD